MITTKCYFFGREMPCDVFWAKYGWIFAFPFLLIGLILAIKPRLVSEASNLVA